MGLEANCVAWLDGQVSEGKAQLESEQVIFRGEFKITVQFHSIQHLSVASGKISILFDKGTLVLDLGALASKWEHKIRNPKSLLDKLGVKLGMKVGVQGVRDTGFLKEPRSTCQNRIHSITLMITHGSCGTSQK